MRLCTCLNDSSSLSQPCEGCWFEQVCSPQVGDTLKAGTLAAFGATVGSLLALAADAVAGVSLAATLASLGLLTLIVLSFKAPPLLHKFCFLALVVSLWANFSMGGTDSLYTLGLIATMLVGVASSLVVTLPVPYIMCSRRVNRDEVPTLKRLFASAVENLRKGVLSDSLAEMWRRQIRAEALREEMSNKMQALSSEKECILWEGLINGRARKTQGVKGKRAIEGDHQRKPVQTHAFSPCVRATQ